MKKLFFVALLLGLFCLSAGWPQDVGLSQMSLDQLSSSLLKTLEDSKNKIVNLQQSLTISSEALNQSKSDLTTLRAESNQLKLMQEEQNRILTEQSKSLLSINEELTNSLRTIDATKLKLKIAIKWVIVLAAICVIFILLKIVAIILRIKFQIKLPWIVDVLV